MEDIKRRIVAVIETAKDPATVALAHELLRIADMAEGEFEGLKARHRAGITHPPTPFTAAPTVTETVPELRKR